jgi:asparagine synthase (glutamine-hydrolysing)
MLNSNIHLQSKSWYQNSNVYATGFIIDESGIYSKDRLCVRVLEFVNNTNQTISGEFAAIIVEQEQVRIITDAIRSRPLFFTFRNGYLHISDECYVLRIEQQNNSLNEEAVKSFLYSGYTHSNYTLNKDIFQVEAGTIVTIKNRNTEIFDYVNSVDVTIKQQTPEDLLKVLSNVFDDYIERLNGREVAVSLSGGYDSRLVLAMLHLKKYDRINCFSYGRPSLIELDNAKLVVEKLGCPWEYLNYDEIFDAKILQDNFFIDYCRYASNDASMFFLKQYFPAAYVKANNLIDSDAVIIAGHTGDVLSGGHLSSIMNSGNFTKDTFVKHLLRKHFDFYSDNSDLFKIISEAVCFEDSLHPWLQYESWERKNRQAKFIVNSNRAYNYFGYETLVPLWDRRLIDFFRKLPFEQKIHSKLYRETLKELVFKPLRINTIQETQPSRNQLLKQQIKEQIKKVIPKSLTNLLVNYSDPFYYKEVIKLMESAAYQFEMPRQKNIWNAYLPQWYLQNEYQLKYKDIQRLM